MKIRVRRCAGRRRAVQIFAATVLFLSSCLALYSQANLGRILGTIIDQSGGVMAGATVTVTDVDRGIARTLITDQAGEYVAPNLQPGSYAVRAEAKGFRITEHP